MESTPISETLGSAFSMGPQPGNIATVVVAVLQVSQQRLPRLRERPEVPKQTPLTPEPRPSWSLL